MKSISFSLACDLKLANLLVGIRNHASTHHVLGVSQNLLHMRLQPQEHWVGFDSCARSSTRPEEYWNKAQKFENCINEPLLDEEGETKILDIIPPPELHLMLGTVNRIFDALNSAWGDDNAYKWASKNNITQVGYHGGCLEGNKCSLLLKKVPDLVYCLSD